MLENEEKHKNKHISVNELNGLR